MNQQILDLASSYLQAAVAPQAGAIDRDPVALKAALTGLGDRSLLGLMVPQDWSGPEVDIGTYRAFMQLVARYSGALAFLQTQHQSAARRIASSDNEALKSAYLPYMSNGEVLLGVGFSQLRRPGPPLVKALPVEGGYQIDGLVPWITGFGLFQEFTIGATLPDGRALFGLVPLRKTSNIAFSEPMELVAMTSTNTVRATFRNWFLPQQQVISIKPAGWYRENDKKNVLHHSLFPLGCARAGLDIVENTAKVKNLPFIGDALISLNRELTNCDRAIMAAGPQDSFDDRLELRAWAIDLAVRCAHAAVAVSSGAANYSDHPAQRVYREAMVYTVFGQTTAVMEATLARLISKNAQ
ncbi:MAG: acyl-CoA/acyl-ACP dehydrogenase [Hormoscilla sp. GUM202]|nr:acyl-CoA/acyl-ACP dehydrogenase [Hormoscilla sp. GUM202]